MYFIQLMQLLLVYAKTKLFLTWNANETAIWENNLSNF